MIFIELSFVDAIISRPYDQKRGYRAVGTAYMPSTRTISPKM
ncbi:MAG: hypothetical protein SH821_02435 [Phototrophicales bacterium]|nr:hypothetical protein [Phototrophicales bacterium]